MITVATNNNLSFDITVVGAGFAGSLTALGLHQIGYDVALIEKSSHPRFAIGESSTPIADLILRSISDRYNLPWLREISRYGSWQQTHPQISCGLKRGFSYYKHQAMQSFETDIHHKNELLVAASSNNEQSDTNWYRSDMDAFFVNQVVQKGIPYWDNTQITNLQRHGSIWRLTAQEPGHKFTVRTKWLIDATGSSSILSQLDVQTIPDHFKTNTRAIFSHFSKVHFWQDWLHKNNIATGDYPYNPDDSALHHLLEEGWLWMLRFNNGITSAGLVLNQNAERHAKNWDRIIGRYPSLAACFSGAEPAHSPGKLIRTKRLQRRAAKAIGEGWVALPHTVGFVDPLHSTGIAHTLSGVERILHTFESAGDKPNLITNQLRNYEQAVFNELDFVDLLIDGCYRAMDHFELFHTYASLYFIAAIHYEQRRIHGDFGIEEDFLSADHSKIRSIVENSYNNLMILLEQQTINTSEIRSFRKATEMAIEPFNIAELLHPEIPNMYYHTSAEF